MYQLINADSPIFTPVRPPEADAAVLQDTDSSASQACCMLCQHLRLTRTIPYPW